MKHIKNCITCSVILDESNWYPSFVGKKHYKCKSCYDERRMENRFKKKYGINNNMKARFIHYKTKKEFDTVVEGEVYIIINPSYSEWIKIGMAVDAEDRLKQYQTSSPYRDYELYTKYFVEDRRESERKSHVLLDKYFERKGEWFKCSPSQAKELLDDLLIKEVNEQLELAI